MQPLRCPLSAGGAGLVSLPCLPAPEEPGREEEATLKTCLGDLAVAVEKNPTSFLYQPAEQPSPESQGQPLQWQRMWGGI